MLGRRFLRQTIASFHEDETLAFALKTGVLAILVAIIYVLPHLLFVKDLGVRYQGVALMGSSDEEFYVARIARIMSGDYRLGDPYLYEHRDEPWVQPPLPELVLGTIGRLSGLSITDFVILMDAVLPAFAAVLASLLLFRLTQSANMAVLGSATLLLGNSMPRVPDLVGVVLGQWPMEPLLFSRPVHPQFSVNLFLVTMILLYQTLVSKSLKWPWLAGLTFGVLFYTYLYFWTFVVAGITILLAWKIACGQWQTAYRLFIVLAVGAVIGLPLWIHLYSVMKNQDYVDMAKRIGLISSRTPIFSKLLLGAIPIFALGHRRDRAIYPFVLSFMLGGLLLYNQHVLTGRHLQPGHWHWYAVKPWLVFAGFVLAADWIGRGRSRILPSMGLSRLQAVIGILVFVLILSNAFFVQISYFHHADEYRAYQDLMPIFKWLNAHTSPDDVVLAGDTVSRLIPIYTHNNVYITDFTATASLVPTAELQRRRLIAWILYGVPPKRITTYVTRYSGALFGLYYRELYGDYIVPKSEMLRLQQQYSELGRRPVQDLMSAYRLDYILYTPYERREFGTNISLLYQNCEIVYENDSAIIFRVRRQRARLHSR